MQPIMKSRLRQFYSLGNAWAPARSPRIRLAQTTSNATKSAIGPAIRLKFGARCIRRLVREYLYRISTG
jgi:hypothetical protein